MTDDLIFKPLKFRNLTIKNRVMRSSISGRFDNYDGSGTVARLNWEEKFARGGVGAIISAHTPIHMTGRILPNYAMLDRDDRIPFYREMTRRVHEHDCKLILQLAHSGRQRDIPGVENENHRALSSTSRRDALTGVPCRAMTKDEIKEMVEWFAQAARRAREAGVDGIEVHAAHGYLITQFLSSGINNRKDEYGGSLENRARLLMEIIAATRREVGDDFHVQMKISMIDFNNYPFFWEKRGNTLEESIQVCKWAEEAGIHAFHVSMGSSFPHPINPKGGWPFEEAANTYDIMLSNGRHTWRNYLLFKVPFLRPAFSLLWNSIRRKLGNDIEGADLFVAEALKKAVNVPVICTGGFQTASFIREALGNEQCDAVSIARSLVANNDLVNMFASGLDAAPKPCTYCNRCMLQAYENPVGCYDLSRFDGDEEAMMKEVMSVFEPSLY